MKVSTGSRVENMGPTGPTENNYRVMETIRIQGTDGLHAAISAKLVQTASKYNVDFDLHYNGATVDLKSILGIMSLVIPSNALVEITAQGSRASEALEEIEKLLTEI